MENRNQNEYDGGACYQLCKPVSTQTGVKIVSLKEMDHQQQFYSLKLNVNVAILWLLCSSQDNLQKSIAKIFCMESIKF